MVLLVIIVALLVAVVVKGDSNVTVQVTPSEIERGNAFLVTIQTQVANTTFTLDIVDERGGTLIIRNQTNANGFWQQRIGIFLDFGTYRVLVTLYNATDTIVGFDQTTFSVTCRGVCVSEQLRYLFGQFSASIADYIVRMTILLFVAYAGIEIPRTIAWIYKEHARAKAEGRITFLQLLAYPFASIRSFIAPSRQGVHPRANERIAVDEARRRMLEQLHRATSERYSTYDLEHVQTLKKLVGDLGTLTERQRAISTLPPRVYHTFKAMPAQLQETYNELVQPSRENPKVLAMRTWKRRAIAGGLAFLMLGIPALIINVLWLLASFFDARPLAFLWRPWMETFEPIPYAFIAMAVFSVTLWAFMATFALYRELKSVVR